MEFFGEVQSMDFSEIEAIDVVDREVSYNLKNESEDHSLVDSVEGQDCSNSKEPQKLSIEDDQSTESDRTRNEDESKNSKNINEEDVSLQIKGELTENLNWMVDGEVEIIQMSTETTAIEVDSNEEEEGCNNSKLKETQMLCDFDGVVKRMEEKVSEVEDGNFEISEKEEAENDVTNSDSEVEDSVFRTEMKDSDLPVDKKINGESEDCNNFIETNDASKGTTNNLEENENEQLLEKTRKRKSDFSGESEDFNGNLKIKKVEITEIEISPNSIAEINENNANFTPETTSNLLERSKTFEKEENEFNEETRSCDNIHHCVGTVDPETKQTEAKSTSTEAVKADIEEGEDPMNLKDEEKPMIINEKAVENIFTKQETFEKPQKCDHLQENEEDNNDCKIHNNVIVGKEATKMDTSAQDTNNTEKDEGDKENLKRKCDYPEEAEPSAKIAKREPKPVECELVEPESVGPEPVECEIVEPEPVECEIVEPELVECDIVEPEPVECEIVELEPVECEIVEPERVECEIVEHESVKCEIVEAESVELQLVEHESVEPDALELEPAEPEPIEPEPEPENPDESAKKSEVNTDLIQLIFQNPMTSAWESKLHKPYELHTLGSDTEEYKTVKLKFTLTSNRLTVKEIKRVENPYLLGIYLLKKDKLERNSNCSAQERCLFHGTRESSVDGICRFNFDWRRNGRSRGHKFGQGVSFSPKSSYSRHYGSGTVMFLAKVLVSQVVEGNRDTVIPPEPYDSTRNHSGDVIVKYSDDDFYPQYIIYYVYNDDSDDDFW